MGKITQEKMEIISEVLHKYFSSLKYKQIKKCKIFKAEMMAAYIEKRLSPGEEKKYEKHLFNCKYCLNIYTNLKNEINILFRIKLKKISKELLTEAFHFIEKEYKTNRLDLNISKIIIKIKDKGFELIEAINFNKIKPVLVPALRDKNIALLKEILLEADFKNNVYQLKIQSYSNNLISMKINFPNTMYEEIKGNKLEIISKDTKISKNIEKDMRLDDLPKGNYKLLINHSILIKFGVI